MSFRSVSGTNASRKILIGVLVCGEPCDRQTCVTCLSPAEKAVIVDIIAQRPLSEINLVSRDISERLITLECGHIFTVETLDMHCDMSTYYEIDMTGEYVAPIEPLISYQPAPTCPSCLEPITALRYGRVTKRANSDILEQTLATNMFNTLRCSSSAVTLTGANIHKLEELAENLKFREASRDSGELPGLEIKRYVEMLHEPFPAELFDENAMVLVHGLCGLDAQDWDTVVRDLIQTYHGVVAVAKTRSDHVGAYDTTLRLLYQLELKEIAADPVRDIERPETIAMKAVRRKIGQPPHNAFQRFQVEAFMISVEVRFMLGQVARARFIHLSSTPGDSFMVHARQLWSKFIAFIYQSCIIDCRKTILIAERSLASRQTARAAMMQLQAEFEMFSFETMIRREEIFKEPLFQKRTTARDSLIEKVHSAKANAKYFLERVMDSYLGTRPTATSNASELSRERSWFLKNCEKRAQQILKDYDGLSDFVTKGISYQFLKYRERVNPIEVSRFCEWTTVLQRASF